MEDNELRRSAAVARSMSASIAALTRWAHDADPHAALAPARQGFLSKFEREVDPDGVLDPRERAVRADRARRAHMKRLAMKSVESRKRPK